MLLLACENVTSLEQVIETSKQGIKKAKSAKDKIQNEVKKIRRAKAKVDRELSDKNQKWREDFEEDIKQARVEIIERQNYLYCQLRSTKSPFKVIKQDHLTSIAWFVNEAQVTRGQMECGSGGASLGVGMGQGGRDCDKIGGPHEPQGLYSYQVPKTAPDNSQFVCRLSFPKTPKEILKNLLSIDDNSLSHVSSQPVLWSKWQKLRNIPIHKQGR